MLATVSSRSNEHVQSKKPKVRLFEIRRKATRSYLHGFALSDKYTVKFTSK